MSLMYYSAHNQRGISTFWGISIILMEVVVVFFVFYILYFFWIENPTPTSNILLVRAFNRQVISIPDTIDTEGWLTYANSSLGFSLQYPAGYQVFEEEIQYGKYEGRSLTLEQTDAVTFTLRSFPVIDGETIPEAYERLTGVKPSIYQSFGEKVAGQPAMVYRLSPSNQSSDVLYFEGNNYLFESPFNATSASILATFTFIE